MMNLSLVDPLLQLKPVPPHVFWDGKAFKAFPASGLPTGFRNTGKTLVLVHGMNSNADEAFSHCVEKYKKEYGYDQVVAFNYDWTKGFEESGPKLAAFLEVLKLRGITNVDLIAHSEGVPVTLAGTSLTDIGIGKIVALGGPIMGTPLANVGVGLATALLYPLYTVEVASPRLETLALVGASTIEDLLARGFGQDLRIGSDVMERIRNRFAAQRSGTVLYLLAATNPTGSPDMAKLSKVTGKIFRFLDEPHDALVGRSSALAEAWNPGNGLKIKRLGSLPLSHTQLECDEAAIERVKNAINPPAPEVIVRTNAGPVTSNTLLLTSENGTQATFEVLLSREPEDSVTINLGTNDDTEGVANPLSFTFTRDDWFRAQQVVIEGVDDNLADGDQNYKIVIAPAVSNDPAFSGRDPQDVSVKNLDNDRFISISECPSEIEFEPRGGEGELRKKPRR